MSSVETGTGRRRVEFFSHPLCSGCSDVRQMLRTLEGELGDVIEVERWNLAVPGGRVRAQELEVTEVPTIVIDGAEMIIGVPDDIDELRRRLVAPGVPESDRG
ncbi:MAG TPA: hypothetical protein VI854_06940 [Acidimicrobiia bacterium]|nr:hypothetical protein [Acidimicrobiia bacterium]